LAGWYFRYQSIHIQITYTYLSFTRQHFHIQSFISPLHGNIVWSYPLSLLYNATFSYSILYLSFTRQHFHIQSFISPLHGNIVWSYPLSLLYKATFSYPILYLSFTRQQILRYGISVLQMTTDMFHLSQTLPGSFLIHDLSLGL
jgi:hypothetical protein